VVDTSATIEAGTANVLPGQVIRTIETFEDTGDSTLVVRATISQGTLIFKKPGLPHGVKVRFNGKRRVAITAGVFNDDTRRTKLVLQLLDFSDYVSIEIQLNAGVIRGAVTDDQGGAHEIGDISNDVFVAGETYRLKLRAIKVQDIFVPGIFDNLQVDRYSGVDPNLSIHFVYDQDRGLIGEYDSAGIPLADYVHLSGQPIAVLRGSSVRYHHADHLGTSKSLTDDSQNIVWGADYTPFGETIIIERVAENSLRYPGQYFDAETGLHYNYFRDYDPSVGRYGQSDPIGLRGGVNTYVYVEQNPIRYTDRFGLHHDGKGCVDGVGRPVSCPRDVCATAECAARVLPNPSTFCERECAIIASGVSSSVSFPGTKQLMKSSGKLVGGFVGQLLVDPLISIQAYQSCVQSRCQSQGPLCLPDQFTGS
jgi:RHS repeat-associated protein